MKKRSLMFRVFDMYNNRGVSMTVAYFLEYCSHHKLCHPPHLKFNVFLGTQLYSTVVYYIY